ncbi:MAG: DUF1700 domain-containing protein [Clostridiales Family XIII bacterium]|nr:DUF1700 domain-containing protein [Clostridiales Family XIII bacterium]
MNKYEYITKLEKRLKKLPPAERANAISYYSEYLEEAGPEGVDAAMAGLGSPSQLAAAILAESAASEMESEAPKVRRGLSAVWFAILGIFALPIALPIAIALFAVAFSVLIAIFSVYISLFAAAIALVGGGLVSVIAGLCAIPISLPVALFYIGGGLICVALGLSLSYGIYKLVWLTCRGVSKIFSGIRNRKGRKRQTVFTNKEANV